MMEFVRLGLINAHRNLGRSLVTVIAMAVAGVMMTASLSVQEGYGADRAEAYRGFLGGDILIYGEPSLLSVAQLGEASPSSWRWERYSGDLLGPLAYFHPDMHYRGYARSPQRSMPVAASATELEQLIQVVEDTEGVSGVNPYWVLPVPTLHFDRFGTPFVVENSVLRSWPFHDCGHRDVMEEAMVSGRFFLPEDDGKAVAVVDQTRAHLSRLDVENVALPGRGEVITVTIPRPWRDDHGQVHFDYTRAQQFDLTIVGSYALPSRTVAWTITVGEEEILLTEELYFTTPEILIPPATFAAMVESMARGAGDVAMADVLSPAALGVRVENFAFVERLASAIRHRLGDHSVISVPRQGDLANQAYLPEPIFRKPVEDMPLSRQRGYPVNVAPVFNVVLFLVAALIAATNAAILVLERRKEISILKAVGGTEGNIVLMVLSEVLALSLAGALFGFAVVRVYATSVLLSTQTAWRDILAITLREGGLVLAATALAAGFFALVPALSTIRLSALEVLKE